MPGTNVSPERLFVIDGKIENFSQGQRGNCRLLAELHSLSEKSWGAKAIFDAQQLDGSGGVTISFQSTGREHCYDENFQIEKTKLPAQSIKITEPEIASVDYDTQVEQILSDPELRSKYAGRTINDVLYKELGLTLPCSSGDPDVKAIELAYEKYAKEHGLLTPGEEDYLRGVGTSITKLFTGDTGKEYRYNGGDPEGDRIIFNVFGEKWNSVLYDKDILLKEYQKNPDDYVCIVAFREEKDGVLTDHAYSLRQIKGSLPGLKKAIVVNPHDTSKEIEIPYYKFMDNVDMIKMYKDPSKDFNRDLINNAKEEGSYTYEQADIDNRIKIENTVEDFKEEIKQDLETKKNVLKAFSEKLGFNDMYNSVLKPIGEKAKEFFTECFSEENLKKYRQAELEAQQ